MTTYKSDFYNLYAEYLNEPNVRAAHDKMLAYFGLKGDVIDIGSGMGEYYHYYQKHTLGKYCPIDKNNPNNLSNFIQQDYRDLSFIRQLPFKPTVFVSLFSVECCYAPADKYGFYMRLFEALPSLKTGLVAGFYYRSKAKELLVKENGGIESFQTIENQDDWKNNVFSEERMTIPVPSKMFGKDVVEIWKIFKK